MNSYPKDEQLTGIYVKRCKCGARPYLDRCPAFITTWWIACNCGRIGKSDIDQDIAIENWNNNKLSYNE